MIYALAHFTTKLKPTIDPVKCRYIKAEEITQFHQRSRMVSENAGNALMRIGGSIYRMEGNFGGGKIWQIKQNITVGEIKFGELLAKRMPYLIRLLIAVPGPEVRTCGVPHLSVVWRLGSATN